MRDSLFFFLNGQPTCVAGRAALGMLAPFLRREKGLMGTKIACAEGACGSCSVLLGRPNGEGFDYAPINSCIFPVSGCDGAHVVTVEGLSGPDFVGGRDGDELSPLQSAMVECHGAQCGFCTPGIVIALTAFQENAAQTDAAAALEGNLCRCTGYTPILEAAASLQTASFRPLNEIYPPQPLLQALDARKSEDLEIFVAPDEIEGAQHLFAPRSFAEAVRWKATHPGAVVMAGGTEIGVAMSTDGFAPPEILSLARVDGLDEIAVKNGVLILGARATWTQVAAVARDSAPEFAALLRRWGSPQLRNVGTVAGNIVRASPISDSLPFLLVCDAEIELASVAGARRVPIAGFLENGPDLRPGELLRRVLVPLPPSDVVLRLFKVSRRRAFDRSLVSAAFCMAHRGGNIESIKIAFGGVAHQAVRLPQTEEFLRGKPLAAAVWREAGRRAQSEIAPLSNSAASREYRCQLVANLFRKFGSEI